MNRYALTLVLSLLLPGAAEAQSKGDAAAGRAIAERWCAACHIVSPEQTSGNADVLTFMTIAKQADDELGSLKVFLADPHPVMPDMSLTGQEIRDIAAYIASLG
ncbi:MAG TPA: c-type cytochrome [Aurantimonas sp.]|uniref:C-type cytochrome n=1 Tax=Aurantimonas marianensis TaxID=2920428 RepID=A0A9X2KDC2_9HYPH|nr:c-type cytochrome [Aurantimonas marianensis]MCP3054233.1 c-type cytochrome [Aurantimonas marianensis]